MLLVSVLYMFISGTLLTRRLPAVPHRPASDCAGESISLSTKLVAPGSSFIFFLLLGFGKD